MKRIALGDTIQAWSETPKGTRYIATGEAVYIHPSGRWVCLDTGKHRESFMMEDVLGGKRKKRRRK